MAETTEKSKHAGFRRGLNIIYNTKPAADYARCLKEVHDVCTTTEVRNSSDSSYYNKMKGKTPLSVAEIEKLNAVFARYGVTDWQGNE